MSRPMLRAAVLAGTVVRITRAPVRAVLRAAPGLVGAAAVATGAGEFAGHVFGHGLTPWVGLAIGGAFALLASAEMNRRPAAPRPPPE